MTFQFRIERPFSLWNLTPDVPEPAHGFFMRMVAAEGLPNARTYAAAVGVDATTMLSPKLIETLFKVPLQDEAKDSLRRWTPYKDAGFYRLADCRLGLAQLSTARRRFCPGCIAERPFHRTWWDIVCVRRCPLHGCELESTFGDGRRLNWGWPEFANGPDGGPLGRPMARIDGRHMLEHLILRRLGLVDDDVARPLLDHAELFEIIDICGHIGRFLAHPWIRGAPAMKPGDRPYQTGFEALSGDLAHATATLLAWLEANEKKTFGQGLDKGYGWLRRGNSTVLKLNPRWTELDHAQRQAYASFSKMGRKSVSHRGLAFKYLTLVDVARMHNVRSERLRELLVDLKRLPLDLYFTHAEATDIGLEIASLMTQTDAAQKLGCKPRMMASLARKGLLRGYLGLRTHRRHLFRPGDVDALAERLRTLSVSHAAGRRISLWSHCEEKGITIIEGMRQVLSGELVPASLRGNAVGFNAVRVAVGPPVQAFRSKITAEEITYGRAKAMLGLSRETIPALVAAGILEAGRPGSTRPHLTLASIEAFKARYVNAAAYRKELKSGTHRIVQALDRLGVARHFVDVPGVKDHIVEREEFIRAAGVVELPEDVRNIWTAFRSIVAEVCPAFLTPEALTSQRQTFFNITRLTRFTVEVADGKVMVRKRFNPRASREWAWMLSHRQDVYRTLAVMRLRKVMNSDEVEGEVVLDSEEVMRGVAGAMAAYHWLLLKKEIR
jgi:hypothetical protein